METSASALAFFEKIEEHHDDRRHGAAGDQPRRRRHGDHEHHARRRRRADARDRHPQVARRAAARTSCASSSSRAATLSTLGAMIGIALGIARREDHLVDDAAARRRRAVVARRRDAARHGRRHRLRRVSGAPRLAARPHRRAARGVSMALLTSVTQAFEGVGIALRFPPREQGPRRAHDHGRRARRVRRRRDVVRRARHQRVVPPRRRGGGPDVVLRLSPADRRIQTLRRHRRDLPRAPQSRHHDGRGARHRAAADRSAPSRAHVGDGRDVQVQGPRHLERGRGVYTPNWTDVDGGDIYPGRSFTYAENCNGGARRARERQARRAAVRRLGSDRQGDQIDGVAVHGDRPLSLHGEPDGHADVGGRRRFAEGDHSVRDGPAPPATSGCAATISS